MSENIAKLLLAGAEERIVGLNRLLEPIRLAIVAGNVKPSQLMELLSREGMTPEVVRIIFPQLEMLMDELVKEQIEFARQRQAAKLYTQAQEILRDEVLAYRSNHLQGKKLMRVVKGQLTKAANEVKMRSALVALKGLHLESASELLADLMKGKKAMALKAALGQAQELKEKIDAAVSDKDKAAALNALDLLKKLLTSYEIDWSPLDLTVNALPEAAPSPNPNGAEKSEEVPTEAM